MYQSTNNPDLESGGQYSHTQFGQQQKEMITGLSPINVRHGFIRKVYAILSVQLIITAGCISYTKLTPAVNSGI